MSTEPGRSMERAALELFTEAKIEQTEIDAACPQSNDAGPGGVCLDEAVRG